LLGDNMRRVALSLLMAMPALAQYSGPAILSRGDAPAAMNVPQIDFIPFLSVTGVYDTGLAGVALTPNGQLATGSSEGVEIDFGVSGVHSWKHTRVTVNYGGAARDYTHASYYSGIDQSLLLGVTHEFSRHLIFKLYESAGMFSRTYGLTGISPTVSFDPTTQYTPNTDFFDNRTIYGSTQAQLVYQRTARLSFDFGGDWDVTRRRSSALYGVTGEDALFDVQYRATRHTTVGFNYTFTHFSFNGLFSGTDFNRFSATFSRQISRSWEFTGFGGLTRVDSKFPQVVTIDPVVAALLGVTQGYTISYDLTWVPSYTGRLSKTFQHGFAFLSAGHIMSPGNGLFLTSRTYTASAGYMYTGIRRWSFNLAGSYDRATSVGNILGEYGDASVGLEMSRQLSHVLHVVTGVTARKYQSGSFTAYNHLVWDARVGLSFSPRDIPLRIW